MSDADELEGWLRLTSLPGLGSARQRSLLAAFGLPDRIFAASRSALSAVVGTEGADRVLGSPRPEWLARAQAWAAEPDNHIITLADADYPPALLDIADPPLLLYVKGDPLMLQRPALAIVGARAATAQGEATAAAFARALSAQGLTIVSGLALGIDAAAHRGALATGHTVAVIGTGADRIYPARNAGLARDIAAHGAIVSELPLGTSPLRHNFPLRNRIIAGLAQGVLVVEAALNSGSLITARLASETGREVFAIPGSIHSPQARGCHRLIRDGAKLVETAEDVLEELRGRLGWQSAPHAMPGSKVPPPAAPEPVLAPDSARVLQAIGHEPVDIDTLAPRCGLTVDALYAILLPLELDGHIARVPGGRFQRV